MARKPSKKTAKKQVRKPAKKAARPASSGGRTKPRLLSGGNPQIAKGLGDKPVQDYINAVPGWKRDVCRRIDAIIERTIPRSGGLRKAVKWNSPLYGVGHADPSDTSTVGEWFMSLHCYDKYVKVAFFNGAMLQPPPPGLSRMKDVRYLDVRENDKIDEAQLADWVKQASRLPGERM